MCGRGGVAGDVTITSRQGCVGSTGRRSQQRVEKGQRALRHRVEKRTRKTLRLRVFGLSIIGSRLEEKQIGGEEQGRQGLPPRRESGLEEVWGLEAEDEIESRKKLDAQRKKLQKELRDVENLSCASKEVQDSLKNDLQQLLQEVEQRRHDLMPEHQKVQKISHKIQSIEDKRRTFSERKYCSTGGDAEY